MNWVLWREYRLNRWILILGGVLLVLPYVAGLLAFWEMSVTETVVPTVSEVFVPVTLFSFVATQLVLAILGANAIAGERADRSAEFVAYLPVSRTRRLRAKWTLTLSFVTISWGVSALAALTLMVLDPELMHHPEYYESVLMVVCFATTSLATYALCWLISSYTTNPAFAVLGGLVTAALVAMVVFSAVAMMIFIATDSEPNFRLLMIGYTIVSLPIAGICFWAGTWHYLNRVEP